MDVDLARPGLGRAAALGYGLIQVLPSADGTHAQAFAAGAMLTMLADAMIPEAYEHGGKLTGLLTVLGFIFTASPVGAGIEG